MNLDFLDGVVISSMFWMIISAICLFRGMLAGDQYYPINWSEGYEAGWKAAEEYHETEILEREWGMNV
jgi:hypothetical protein